MQQQPNLFLPLLRDATQVLDFILLPELSSGTLEMAFRLQ
jgi:hypothetical protein